MMKKLLSLVTVAVLCMSCFVAPCAAAENVPPEDGTVMPFGIYGIVEDIGVNPGPAIRVGIFQTDVTLAKGKSFTSYQYEVSSSYNYVMVGIAQLAKDTEFKISLYGSDSVGGRKTLLGSVTSEYTVSADEGKTKRFSNKYKYYNFVITNTGTITGTARGSISAD